MPSICTTMKPRSASDCMLAVGGEGLRHEGALRAGVDVFEDGVLLRRIEVVGGTMTPQMSVLPSRPFATKTSGGF